MKRILNDFNYSVKGQLTKMLKEFAILSLNVQPG